MNKIKKYADLKGRKWDGDGIPKWVFKTGPFEVETLPDIMSSIYNSMVNDNPEYELFFFSDKDCEEFINDEFGEYYLKLYNRLIPGAYKADLWRYLILFTYGGIYGDFTQVMVMKFDDITKDVDRVFCIDSPWAPFALHNAFMACKPNDIVVEEAIKRTIKNLENKDYGSDPLDVTGPVVLGKAYNTITHPEGNILEPIKLGTNGKDKIITYPNDGDIFLKDVDDNPVLVRKLNNHYEYMYNDKPHYGHFWWDRNIFHY